MCEHPEPPADPVARADWYAEMIRTHTVARCPVCQLFKVWTPKPVRV